MTDITRPAATAAQRIVAAMWTLDQPATARQIGQAAAVGYSTVSPVLRHLLAARQAVKSEGADGSTLWQLDPDNATISTTADHDAGTGPRPQNLAASDEPRPGDTTPGDSPEITEHDHGPGEAADCDTVVAGIAQGPDNNPDPEALPATEGIDSPGRITDAEESADTAPAEPVVAEPKPDVAAEPQVAEPDSDTENTSDGDTSSTKATRSYRRPVKPRRPKGALRAAIHAALADEPERAFRVGDMCKIIDVADADGEFNKAGPGAVVNALDKLTTDGHATRVCEAPASYQFHAKPADADSES
jgi:hypothetical protein